MPIFIDTVSEEFALNIDEDLSIVGSLGNTGNVINRIIIRGLLNDEYSKIQHSSFRFNVGASNSPGEFVTRVG